MNILQQSHRWLMAFILVSIVTFTTACGGVAVSEAPSNAPTAAIDRSVGYGQLARGNSAAGQDFGNWVVETAKGLVKDAFVRDNNKLGVVISSQVRPNEVKDLAKSLVQGFRQNFPNQDLSVLMYAPDKQLILTARYDTQSKQIEFQQPTS